MTSCWDLEQVRLTIDELAVGNQVKEVVPRFVCDGETLAIRRVNLIYEQWRLPPRLAIIPTRLSSANFAL